MKNINFKVIQVFVVIAIMFSFCSSMVTPKTFAEPKTVTAVLTLDDPVPIVNGNNDPALELPPFIASKRMMIPIRFISESFEIKIDYESETRIITFYTTKIILKMFYESLTATINGKNIAIDAPFIIRCGRSFVPIRFVMESFGATVTWDPILHKVTIVYEVPSS